ncbi:hypothetical protein [Streptomyces sp. NPDC048172]|uniref:hypothetical protein n=1 Tax=Streptomyces sp. NPDC048172 TaxID=3365505 RepID=UPI00372297C1
MTGKRFVAAGAGALLVPALLAAPAVAQADEAAPRVKKTTCQAVMVEPAAFCRSSKTRWTQVTYYDKGDKIKITDRYDNGRWTKAIVQAEGHPKRYFSSKGKKVRTVRGDFGESWRVRVKVCTSWTKKAKCSPWSRYYPA